MSAFWDGFEKQAAIAGATGKILSSTRISRVARAGEDALDAAYHYGKAAPKSFGAAANRSSAKNFLRSAHSGERDVENLSHHVHEGWGQTAKTFKDPVYKTNPQKQVNRQNLANTEYKALPEAEKEKDRVMSRAMLGESLKQ